MFTFKPIRSFALLLIASISFACGGTETNTAEFSKSSQALERDNTLYGEDAAEAFRNYCATHGGLENDVCEDVRMTVITQVSVPPAFEKSNVRAGQFVCVPWEAAFIETFDWNSDEPSVEYTSYELESAEGEGRKMDCKYTVSVYYLAKPEVTLGGIK